MTFDVMRRSLRKISVSAVAGLSGLMLVAASLMMPTTQALSINSTRDCDANAVIRCGALSLAELKNKYNQTNGAKQIFRHFGITPGHIQNLNNRNTSVGVVTKNGRVIVNGKTVATGAVTAGRQHMPGSTKISNGGATFYTRTPNASFQSNNLKAFVVMNQNGKFLFAIIASCGNPVKATPNMPKKPQPTPAKPTKPHKPKPQPKPQPQPAPSQQQEQEQTSTATATAEANANVTVNQPPAPTPPAPVEKTVVVEKEVPVPAAAPAVVEAPTEVVATELPKTGMEPLGNTLGLAGIATLIGTAAHFLYVRKRPQKTLLNNRD